MGADREGFGRNTELGRGKYSMDKFITLNAKVCPLLLPNLNTDQILPARYLKWPRARGLGSVLFHDLRRDAEGNERADFPLNQAVCSGAKILLAGRNFGGGSSREAAVYAIYDAGFRCVIAPSFGDIFAQNSFKNGLLPAIVSEDNIATLAGILVGNPQQHATVDLQQQMISCLDARFAFTIDAVGRNQLLNGWDDVNLTESYAAAIASFKAREQQRRPWARPSRPQDG